MSRQVICSNPTIIVNPSCLDNILKYRNVTIKGKTTYFHSKLSLFSWRLPHQVIPPYKCVKHHVWNDDKISFVSERVRLIQPSDLEYCYVTNFVTGEVFPVYLEVPCGKCDLCKEAKINSFVERCKMETQQYDCLPWFVTLTYDDDNLPVDGVSVMDVQKFLKRFRVNLERSGYDYRIRYCCSGEYGKTTHRPHYHLIIWGLDSKTPEDFERVSSILYNSWDKGYTMHRFIDPKDDKSFYYTAKYLKKDNVVPTFEAPDGKIYPCNPFFLLQSRKSGGIGCNFIRQVIAPYMRRSLNINTKYINKWTNTPVDVYASSYLLNIVFPSKSRSVPYKFRRSLRDFFEYYTELECLAPFNQFKYIKEQLYDRFKHYCFIPVDFKPCYLYSFLDCVDKIKESLSKILEFELPPIELVNELDFKRSLFMSKLFVNKQPVDLKSKAYVIRKKFNRQLATELM